MLRRIVKPSSYLILVTFTSLCLQPLTIVYSSPHSAMRVMPSALGLDEASLAHENPIESYNRELDRLRRSLQQADTGALAAIRSNLARSAPQVVDELTRVQSKRSSVDYGAYFQSRHNELLDQLGLAISAEGSGKSTALRNLSSLLDREALPRSKKNWKKLAWRSEKALARAPKVNGDQLHQWLQERSSGLRKSFSRAKTLPTSDDRGANVDVQITEAISAQAAALGNNPLAIFNWVKSNVEYLPTYGSAQGSQATLDKKQGNAFDTASLLIALLRAGGTPARYVYGTIQLPAEQVKNWIGGAETVEAAIQVLSQGGIPNHPVMAAGTITAVQLEHVWVEAFVDYYPSRGAVNKTPTTWIAMDASFKQHTFSPGLDISTNVPFDASAALNRALQGATVDAAQGSVQTINQANIQADANDYESRLTTFVTNTGTATVNGVLGSAAIAPRNLSILIAESPYKVLAVGARFSTLPASMRHRFFYSLYPSEASRSLDSPVWSFAEDLPAIVGKEVTIAFVPASDSDAQSLSALLPQPHADGSPITSSELPRVFPNSIHVKAQMLVDGIVRAEAGPFGMGDRLFGRGGFTTLDLTATDLSDDDTLVAGQHSAIGVSVFGVSRAQMASVEARLQNTMGQLQGQVPNTPALTGAAIAGDLLTSGVWSYFATHQSHGSMISRKMGMIDFPALSYGLFHLAAQPNVLFNTVTTGMSVTGVMADIGHLRAVRWSKNGDVQKWQSYNQVRGLFASDIEHRIPENMFVDRTKCGGVDQPACATGVSAVSLLAVAAGSGQKLYLVDQNNVEAALAGIQASTGVTEDIRSAVAAGNQVLVHQQPVSTIGWRGTGYIVIDPETGSGSYLIDGGANGGFLHWVDDNSGIITLVAAIAALFTAPLSLPFLLLLTVCVATLAASLVVFMDSMDGGPCDTTLLYMYVGTTVAALFIGATAQKAVQVLFAWFLGFFLDGSIRGGERGCHASGG